MKPTQLLVPLLLFILLCSSCEQKPLFNIAQTNYLLKEQETERLQIDFNILKGKHLSLEKRLAYEQTFWNELEPPLPLDDLKYESKIDSRDAIKSIYGISKAKEDMFLHLYKELVLQAKDLQNGDSLKQAYQARYINKLKVKLEGAAVPYLELHKFKNLQVLELSLESYPAYLAIEEEREGESVPSKSFTKYLHYIDSSFAKLFTEKVSTKEQEKRLTFVLKSLENNQHLEVLILDALPVYTLPTEICQLKSLRYLVLSTMGLNNLPDCICELKNLEILKIYTNPIKALPKDITQLKKLKTLAINQTALTELSQDFTTLTDLKKLNLANNRLRELPNSIHKLKHLSEFYLYHNNLEKLPKNFIALGNLETLILDNNRLRELPNSIHQLKHLKELDIHNNKLEKLPESLSEMNSLQKIRLAQNNIKQLPKNIGKLSTLKYIDLSFNRLESLPKSLKGSTMTISLTGNLFSDAAQKQLKKDLTSVFFEFSD